MTTRLSTFLSALLVCPVLLAGAAAADIAKTRPNLRAVPQAKSDCPSAPGELRGLRRQPKPSGKTATIRPLRPDETRGLRPQPEPPGKQSQLRPGHPGAKRGFNPQPEPPKTRQLRPLRPDETRGLRPQPEPPGKEALASPC